MEKLTLKQLKEIFFKHNEENNGKALTGIVVISEESLKGYDKTARSYEFSSDNLGFKTGKISKSVWADCLDGKDLGVRLDWYVLGLGGLDWKVEYCYILD